MKYQYRWGIAQKRGGLGRFANLRGRLDKKEGDGVFEEG